MRAAGSEKCLSIQPVMGALHLHWQVETYCILAAAPICVYIRSFLTLINRKQIEVKRFDEHS
jgi:hypothetical protein